MVPFEELFVALSQRQDSSDLEHRRLFFLDRPELDQLRNLIEEARALQDRDRPTLRISRFQVGLWDELIKLGVVVGQAERWISSVRALSSERTKRRERGGHPCPPGRRSGRTSWMGSAGCTCSGTTGLAESSPTTWAWERPFRRSRSSAMPAWRRRRMHHSSSSHRRASCRTGPRGRPLRPDLSVVTIEEPRPTPPAVGRGHCRGRCRGHVLHTVADRRRFLR